MTQRQCFHRHVAATALLIQNRSHLPKALIGGANLLSSKSPPNATCRHSFNGILDPRSFPNRVKYDSLFVGRALSGPRRRLGRNQRGYDDDAGEDQQTESRKTSESMPAIHAVSPQLRFEIPHFDLKRTSSNFSNFILMLVGVYGLILEFASSRVYSPPQSPPLSSRHPRLGNRIRNSDRLTAESRFDRPRRTGS